MGRSAHDYDCVVIDSILVQKPLRSLKDERFQTTKGNTNLSCLTQKSDSDVLPNMALTHPRYFCQIEISDDLVSQSDGGKTHVND